MAFRRVPPGEALELVRDHGYRLVDVRSVPEFTAGHPAGAWNIPLMHRDQATGQMRPNTRFVDEVKLAFTPGDKLVLTCLSGGRSARAAALLQEAGFPEIVDQRAGWGGERDASGRVLTPGWQDAGLPVEGGDGGERGWAAITRK